MAKKEENTDFNYAQKKDNTRRRNAGNTGSVNMVSSKDKQSLKEIGHTLSKLFDYIGRYRKILILGLILAAASSILLMLGPNLVGQMTNFIKDGLYGDIDINAISKIGIMLIVIYGSSNIFGFIQQYTMAGMTAKICKKIRSDFVDKINKLPHSYFNTHIQGDILSCITNDVQTLRTGISRSLPGLTKSIAQFVTCLIMMIITE